jgi:hypothetical protein
MATALTLCPFLVRILARILRSIRARIPIGVSCGVADGDVTEERVEADVVHALERACEQERHTETDSHGGAREQRRERACHVARCIRSAKIESPAFAGLSLAGL